MVAASISDITDNLVQFYRVALEHVQTHSEAPLAEQLALRVSSVAFGVIVLLPVTAAIAYHAFPDLLVTAWAAGCSITQVAAIYFLFLEILMKTIELPLAIAFSSFDAIMRSNREESLRLLQAKIAIEMEGDFALFLHRQYPALSFLPDGGERLYRSQDLLAHMIVVGQFDFSRGGIGSGSIQAQEFLEAFICCHYRYIEIENLIDQLFPAPMEAGYIYLGEQQPHVSELHTKFAHVLLEALREVKQELITHYAYTEEDIAECDSRAYTAMVNMAIYRLLANADIQDDDKIVFKERCRQVCLSEKSNLLELYSTCHALAKRVQEHIRSFEDVSLKNLLAIQDEEDEVSPQVRSTFSQLTTLRLELDKGILSKGSVNFRSAFF